MISPFSAIINSPRRSPLPILVANRGKSVPSTPSPDPEFVAIGQLGRAFVFIQAAASLISIIAIVSLGFLGRFSVFISKFAVRLSNPISTLDLVSLTSLEKALKLCEHSFPFLMCHSNHQMLSFPCRRIH